MTIFDTYQVLSEVANLNEPIIRNTEFENAINAHLGNAKIAPAHTRVLTTKHLQDKNIHVLRFLSHQHKGMEYHIDNNRQYPNPATTVDRRSILHIMGIINKDASAQLKDGKRVVIQSLDPSQHTHYLNLANKLVHNNGKTATDVGMKKLTCADFPGHTIVIESVIESKHDFLDRPTISLVSEMNNKEYTV